MPYIRIVQVLSALALGAIALFALNFSSQPLFDSTDTFVLFAEEEVMLAQDVQVSSGDIGSNNTLDIQKDALISGNLFADRITTDKGSIINGNATFNALKQKKGAEVLGATTSPVQFPIADIPDIPDFTPGTQDFTFSGDGNTLPQGDYRNITLTKDSTLTLTGGIYNITKLDMRESATLIFATTTTLNIEQELKGQQNISILPGATASFDALTINYLGKRGNQKGQGTVPITFGNNSFLNFILIAPNATVNIGERSALRGQVLANKIRVGKDSILSREVAFVKESDPEKVVTDTDGSVFLVNEIMVNFVDSATFADAQEVANLVQGQIVGFVQSANAYQIEVLTSTTQELSDKIETIRQSSNPLVEGVFRSYILDII